MKHEVKNLEELSSWAREFLSAQKGHLDQATIITLSGDLGAGKTALVKACAGHLGIKEDITSPTFVIQKEYKISKYKIFSKLVHIDAYRLEGAIQLEYLGWKDLISDPKNIIFLEWPSQVQGLVLPKAVDLDIRITDDHSRIILVK